VRQLNNAATTPPFRKTLKALNEFLPNYGALHRGAGPKARITCEQTEAAIARIRSFIGCTDSHALLFTQNTSAAINLLARMLQLQRGDVVLTSNIEHTSNSLPWRYNTPARVVEVHAFDDGSLDYADLEAKVKRHGRRLKLIAITGASNQTGYVPDLACIAGLAHSCGARLFVDAAQLAPHRPIDMSAEAIDALAFSAHKIYAPFGLGVLALPAAILRQMPVDPGGGSIDMISDREIFWSAPAERHQTGTWNVPGIIALAASCEAISHAGWDAIRSHEQTLVDYLAALLPSVPGIRLYVPPDSYRRDRRIGVFPLNLPGLHHALLAAVLEHEYGLEVRAGTICNHRLVRRWSGVSDEEQHSIEERIRAGDRLASYGIVRVSLGVQNTREDLDALLDALHSIATRGYSLKYSRQPERETFEPVLPARGADDRLVSPARKLALAKRA
jgi:selenocysteine lyase/cysteine desulfurase